MNWLSTTTAAGADWGNVPGWIAVGVSAICSGIAIRISWKAKNASERSAAASEQSAANGARSADTAAAALSFQQEQAKPKVQLTILPAGKYMYRLINKGGVPAVGIALAAEDEERVQWADPLGDELDAGQGCEFTIASMADIPTALRFTWDGQDRAVYVPMP